MGGFVENTSKDFQAFHIAIAGAICTIAGTFFSGPLAFIAVSSIQPQPEWSGAQVYVAHYHPVQSLTFYFGLILLFGSVLMITSIYFLNRKSIKSLLALIFTAIACGLISFNYFIQASLIPALKWVLSKAGLATYVGWNILYLFLAIFFLIVILRRRVKLLRLST